MEFQTAARPPSCSDSSSAAYPCWVILEQKCKISDDDSSCPTAVSMTLAAARSSNGHPIQVSLGLQKPPATSVVRVKFPDGVRPRSYFTLASHGGSLLIEIKIEQGFGKPSTLDYFVYNAGDAAADPPRPPSLLLLPPYCPIESEGSRCHRRIHDPVNRELGTDCTGILRRRRRRGEDDDDDEIVVAELEMVAVSKDDDTPQTQVAELLLFLSGEWSVKRPQICNGDRGLGELPSQWHTRSVFPVGDTRICWADTSDGGGILLCDVLEESPWLQYGPLPMVPSPCSGRKVCPTAGGTIRFVNIFPRCCCGGAGASKCQRSHYAYTIKTWMLRMDDGDDGMEWVMDGMVDATELWSQDIYKSLPLPRVPLGYPLVSMYEPHVICFVLCESNHVKRGWGDRTVWLLMVDMRSKRIQSVSRHPKWIFGSDLMTSNVSYYLNPYQTCSSGDGTSTGQSHNSQMDIVEKKKIEDDNATNWMLPSPCKSAAEPAAQASSDEILAAIREIPSYGLDNDDMLKAFLFLSGDNGCQVRSLLRQPKNLRKDWLMKEIKADDAYRVIYAFYRQNCVHQES